MQKRPQPPKGPFKLSGTFMIAAILALGYGAGVYKSQQSKTDTAKIDAAEALKLKQTIPYTDFVTKAQHKLITRIEVSPNGGLSGTAPEQPPVLSQQLPGDNIAARLDKEIKNGEVTIDALPPPLHADPAASGDSAGRGTGWTGLIVSVLLMAGLMIGFQMYMQRRMQKGGSGDGMASFGKSKARLIDQNTNQITFADVAGCDEAKEDVKELVDFLKDPHKYAKIGARMPSGVLMVGPPGTGKTLLAKAVAGEAKVPFFSISGSDFVEMFVGVGASRVRDLFETAKKNSPSIIFIDEIDAVGKQRGSGAGGGGNDEREQTLNAILVEMDGFNADTGVIVIAATNRVDTLDAALTRPGRFDRKVYVGLPDINGREQILKVHASKVPLHENVDLRVVARGTPGMAGADLANLINEAALFTARRGGQKVEMRDFEDAKDKIFMGPERKLMMSEESRRNTAWHESGHTIVGKLVPGSDPVHKVTILPRGQSLGSTWTLPEGDTYSLTHGQMLGQIKMFYGGRIAEELLAKGDKLSISTGPSSDIQRLTRMARDMVTRYGFHDPEDDSHGLVTAFYEANERGQYDINSMEAHNDVSRQIQKILKKSEQEVRELLTENIHLLERMSNDLMEYETIDGVDVEMIMKGESIAERKRLESERQKAEDKARAAGNDNQPQQRRDPGKFNMK